MRVFISWSGVRSRALADSLRAWLPRVLGNIDFFDSQDIPKGAIWHTELVAALRDCGLGLFCVTPESLRSEWMLFEAGALAQQGDRPTLFTYLYGLDQVEGPFGHFQATRFERASSRQFVFELAGVMGVTDRPEVLERFDSTWDSFESEVTRTTLVPVQRLIPELPGFFEPSKTFHESFPDCSDKRWDDRLRRTARTHQRLTHPEIAGLLASDPFFGGAYQTLLAALDRYDMHIAGYLLEKSDYHSLPEGPRRHLEDARTHIVDIVNAMQQSLDPPVFRESLAFEWESHDQRKMRIHDLEGALRRGKIGRKKLDAAAQSTDWTLDRIVSYAAWAMGLLPSLGPADIVAALKREEENARSRNLIEPLQPLYHAAECLDERFPDRLDAPTAARLAEVLNRIDDFVNAHEGRDEERHIRRRVESLRKKLASL